jgi:pimeloyl-ACP methyl ester carboxylesterase
MTRLLAALALLIFASPLAADTISDAPSRYAKSAEGKIHYKSFGKGKEALVFIHGWACDMSFFSEQVPHFAKKTRVIVLDLPGHGKSDAPAGAYSQTLFAESVRAVLDDAKVRRAVLVGHSMGMPVSRQFYRLYPKRTAGIVSLDGSLKAMITDPKVVEMIIGSLKGPDYLPAATRMVDGMLSQAPDSPHKAHIREVMLGTPQPVVYGSAEAFLC